MVILLGKRHYILVIIIVEQWVINGIIIVCIGFFHDIP